MVTHYKCPNCNHICTKDDMGVDSIGSVDMEEVWSNHICPNCQMWHTGLSDWTVMDFALASLPPSPPVKQAAYYDDQGNLVMVNL